jgi:uncharacterized Rossmann fold enzyme
MAKRKLLVYLDPGFLENRGHYMNFSRHIHAEAGRRDIEILHFVNSGTSAAYCAQHGLHPVFANTAYLADNTRHEEGMGIVKNIDAAFGRIVAEVAGKAGNYDEIVYYMYTGHPSYISSLALQLARNSHGSCRVAAHVVLFYLSDAFCYGNDDGRYAAFLQAVSVQLEACDPHGRIHVGIDSHTALDMHSQHFSRPVTVVPFPHVQRAELLPFPQKNSVNGGRLRVTYTGYPHSKYGFHLMLDLLGRSISDPLWKFVDVEIKLNFRIKEDDLVGRWKLLKDKISNLHSHEDYMEDSEYLAMIGRADIMLIPYGSQYNHDTSAVLVDALLSGSVIIAAEPTWMAKVYAEHGSGRSYKSEDADSFAAAVTEVITQFPAWQRRTSHSMGGVPWKFGAEGLFDVLFPRWHVSLSSPARAVQGQVQAANDVLLQPYMPALPGTPTAASLELASELDRLELEKDAHRREIKTLLAQLGSLSTGSLPGEKLPLAQRANEMRAVAAAWDRRDHYNALLAKLAPQGKKKRCIVIGADVQLDTETLKALKSDVVFAPQQTFRQFNAIGLSPDFLLFESAAFISGNLATIRALQATAKFVPYHHAHYFQDDPSVIHFNLIPRRSYPTGYDISLRTQDEVYTSVTVVGTAIQIAMGLGYTEICLLGVHVSENNQDKAELSKFYAEVAKVSKANDIDVFNICINTSIPYINYTKLEPFTGTQQRAREVLENAAAGKIDVDWSDAEIAAVEKLMLGKHPCPSEIYLPTSKYSGASRLVAISKVVKAWNERQDIYRSRLRKARADMQGRDRCFIIGNGPSLNQTNLDLLDGEVTFATNGIFLKFEDTRFRPTFYVVEDHLVGEDRYTEINQLRGFTKLAPYYLAYCLEDGDDIIYYNHRGRKSFPYGFDFSTNAEEITYTGCTVTFSCMQLAYYMGFKNIYLIGVDMSYVIPEQVKKANEYDTEILDMEVDDPNHFIPNYFGRGYRWHDPNVDKMEQAYIEARKVTDQLGVRIINATVGGKCEVFERVDYYSLFGERGPKAKAAIVARPVVAAPALTPAPSTPAMSVTPAAPISSASGFQGVVRATNPFCLAVNKTIGNSPLSLSLPFDRSVSRFLVLELFDAASADRLAGLSIRLDGQPVPFSIFKEQLPVCISFLLPALSGKSVTEMTIATSEEGSGEVNVKWVLNVPATSFVKAEFPLSHFDGLAYLRHNPDVAKAVEERRELSAMAHYIGKGRAEGRHFIFATDSRPNQGWRYEWIASR